MSASPHVIFVTDPLCSWCWGMLPHMEEARRELDGQMTFDLWMAGIQVGGLEPLGPRGRERLENLWQEVAAVTGQRFLGRAPADPGFRYHSEMPCRAVEAMRVHLSEAPWQFFYRLQESFYVAGVNIVDPEQLQRLGEEFGMARDDLRRALHSERVKQTTRSNFESAKALGAVALPSVLADTGDGPKLVSGGFTTTEFLVPALLARVE